MGCSDSCSATLRAPVPGGQGTMSGETLYSKLARISGELGAIQKDGRAPESMGGFSCISHGAVMAHLRGELSKAQVAVLESLDVISDEPFVMHTHKGDKDARRIVVKLTVTFVNGESPEERH